MKNTQLQSKRKIKKVERDFFEQLEEMIEEDEARRNGPCEGCNRNRELNEITMGKDYKYLCSSCASSVAPLLKPARQRKIEIIGNVRIG